MLRSVALAALALAAVLAAPEIVSGDSTPLECAAGGSVDDGVPAPENVFAAPIGYRGGGGKFSALLTWGDESGIPTCFVIERFLGIHEPSDSDFEVIAILRRGSDSAFTDHGPYTSNGTIAFYRMYAATALARSQYSDVTYASFPIVDTPPPTPSPTPTSRGDLNCDGVVDGRDALPVLREEAGLNPGLPDSCPSLSAGGAASTRLLAVPAVFVLGALLFVRRRTGGE